jgi:glycolate oxidase
VVLCTEQMRAIVEINPGERLAVVQPGVVNDDLRNAAAERDLWYPPDPGSASSSTIGGNVATNAGGLCCVKYGVTRDYVLALEVVTASGEVVRLGRRTAKGVAGYDLVGLMVGSEGTLGVITEVTVRLRPARSAPTRTVVGFFDTLPACGAAVAGVTARGLEPAVFELIDRHCLAAVNEWKHTGLPEDAAALLLAQTDIPEPGAHAQAEAIHAGSSRPAPPRCSCPPTPTRPKHSSPPDGWCFRRCSSVGTRSWSRTSACPAGDWPRC